MKEENTYNEHIGMNLPDNLRMNPFSVPKGYFDDLGHSVLSQIIEQKLKDSIGRSTDGFGVPTDYFEDFAAQVNTRIAVERLEDEVSETGFRVPEGYFEESQSGIYAALRAEKLRDQITEEGFTVPEGYFEELAQHSMTMARIEQSASSDKFAVPAGYFDTLSARIQTKIAAEKVTSDSTDTDTPVVRIPARKNWTQYAAAAVVALLVGVGSYWAVDSSRQAQDGTAQQLALEELSNEEIFSYLTQVTDGVELIELATFLPEGSNEDATYEVNEQFKDQEIEEYLNYML